MRGRSLRDLARRAQAAKRSKRGACKRARRHVVRLRCEWSDRVGPDGRSASADGAANAHEKSRRNGPVGSWESKGAVATPGQGSPVAGDRRGAVATPSDQIASVVKPGKQQSQVMVGLPPPIHLPAPFRVKRTSICWGMLPDDRRASHDCARIVDGDGLDFKWRMASSVPLTRSSNPGDAFAGRSLRPSLRGADSRVTRWAGREAVHAHRIAAQFHNDTARGGRGGPAQWNRHGRASTDPFRFVIDLTFP